MDIMEMIDRAQDSVTVGRVFGEPSTRNGITVIPVARIAGGGGGGSGKQEGERAGEGSGGGFGLGATPAGVFVVTDDDVRWLPAIDFTKVIMGAQAVAIVTLLVIGRYLKRRAGR